MKKNEFQNEVLNFRKQKIKIKITIKKLEKRKNDDIQKSIKTKIKEAENFILKKLKTNKN
ncbi:MULTISPECIES: hypothetical protein [unclassified Cellulophaga]|uniref:hypothetical protein n=1 Tax=unclassified Cellulophaga TaxID=2634405 RepID=UPI0026E3F9A0|nr:MULTISPECIES: hypothetical protein [unclassified Cellulophaga]MDO6491381.1 hypothetical protein [Cellulophaga sp. 2_MG-2023]MDO6495086.1 hypothetical protein [Cellulophaga sp. 3_MG-2023]